MRNASHLHLLAFVLCAVALTSRISAAAGPVVDARSARGLQDLVDRLRAELGIDASVSTEVVAANPLLVSVQPVRDDAASGFVMSFEERFLAGVDDDELRAIVAHELGHVWIFTHHPYLQTERLANSVAMRAVTRAHLERVYSKVWERAGSKGDLAHFLGQERR